MRQLLEIIVVKVDIPGLPIAVDFHGDKRFKSTTIYSRIRHGFAAFIFLFDYIQNATTESPKYTERVNLFSFGFRQWFGCIEKENEKCQEKKSSYTRKNKTNKCK